MFHAVVMSTAPWWLETVPLPQTIGRSLDVNTTSMFSFILHVKRRPDKD